MSRNQTPVDDTTRMRVKERRLDRRLFRLPNDGINDEWLNGERLIESLTASSDHSLSNLVDQGTGVGHDPRQALGRLPLLQWHEPLHARPRAHQSAHELPEFPKSWTVLGKSQGLVPPDDLSTHHQYGSIGVRSRSFVE